MEDNKIAYSYDELSQKTEQFKKYLLDFCSKNNCFVDVRFVHSKPIGFTELEWLIQNKKELISINIEINKPLSRDGR